VKRFVTSGIGDHQLLAGLVRRLFSRPIYRLQRMRD
jgi:hypothetical protein